MDNLEEFLSDEPQAIDPAPADPEPQAEPEPAERPRGPDGKFVAKSEPAPADPAPAEPQLDHAALIGERRRRQEAEQQLEQLRAQYAQPQQQPAPQSPPDRWEDPEGYDQWLIGQAARQAEQRAMQAVQQQRIYDSAVRARAKHEDYDTAHAVFGEMVQANPALFQRMLGEADPAEFAYNAAKTEMDIRQYGGLDKLVEARVAARLAEAQPAAPSIPGTLADAQSARGSTASLHVPTLDEILKR